MQAKSERNNITGIFSEETVAKYKPRVGRISVYRMWMSSSFSFVPSTTRFLKLLDFARQSVVSLLCGTLALIFTLIKSFHSLRGMLKPSCNIPAGKLVQSQSLAKVYKRNIHEAIGHLKPPPEVNHSAG